MYIVVHIYNNRKYTEYWIAENHAIERVMFLRRVVGGQAWLEQDSSYIGPARWSD